MRRTLLTLALCSLLFATGVVYKRGPGGGGGAAVPGLSGGIGNYDTLGYLLTLPSFQNLPGTLQPIYFSADANPDSLTGCEGGPVLNGPRKGTCLPAGLDTNDGSVQSPYLTLTRCHTLSAFGNVQCVFDAADSWNVAADLGADVDGFDRATTAVCDPAEPCIVWSGSDRTGANRATFDCAGMFGANVMESLFDDNLTTSAGFWAFENIDLNNCPGATAGSTGDLFRTDGPGDMAALNVSVPNLIGAANEVFTTHNSQPVAGGPGHSQFIGVNVDCHIDDFVGASAFCHWSVGDADVIWIGSDFSSSYDDVAVQTTIFRLYGGATTGAGDPASFNTTLVGNSFREIRAASAGGDTWATEQFVGTGAGADTGLQNWAMLLNTISGFVLDAGGGDRSFLGGWSNVSDNNTIAGFVYKNSFANGTGVAWRLDVNAGGAGNIYNLSGACNLVDGFSTGNLSVGPTDCAGVNVSLLDNVFDESVGAGEYVIEGVNFTNAAAAVAGAVTQGCVTPWVLGVTPASADQYGGVNDPPYCRHADCARGCDTPGLRTFPNAQVIPSWFIGGEEDLRGLSFPATPATHAGR